MATPMEILSGALLAKQQEAQPAQPQQSALDIQQVFTPPGGGGGRSSGGGGGTPTLAPSVATAPSLVPDLFSRPPQQVQPQPAPIPSAPAPAPAPVPPAQTGPDPALVQQAMTLQALLQGALNSPTGFASLLNQLGVSGPIAFGGAGGPFAGPFSSAIAPTFGFAPPSLFGPGNVTGFGDALSQAFGSLDPALQAIPELGALFSGNENIFSVQPQGSGAFNAGVNPVPINAALMALASFLGGL